MGAGPAHEAAAPRAAGRNRPGRTASPDSVQPSPPLSNGSRTDRAGFEPAVPLARYAGLANRCLQPLGHLSGLFILRSGSYLPNTCQRPHQRAALTLRHLLLRWSCVPRVHIRGPWVLLQGRDRPVSFPISHKKPRSATAGYTRISRIHDHGQVVVMQRNSIILQLGCITLAPPGNFSGEYFSQQSGL